MSKGVVKTKNEEGYMDVKLKLEPLDGTGFPELAKVTTERLPIGVEVYDVQVKVEPGDADIFTLPLNRAIFHPELSKSDDDGIGYRCKLCNYSSQSKNLLRLHKQRTHAPHKPVACSHCGKVYSNDLKLQSHIRIYHAPAEVSRCDLCGKQLCNKQSMKEHKKLVHGERLFVCNLDGKSFATDKSLQRHIDGVHNGVFKKVETEDLCCPICDYQTNRQLLFNKHMKTTHAPAEQCVCKHCDREFENAHKMQHHIWRYHNVTVEELTCEECGRKLCNKQSLQRHKMTMHSQQQQVACPYDGKMFNSPISLQRHTKYVHLQTKVDDDKEWRCELCNYVTKKRINLQCHTRRIHSGQPVSCDHCLKVYATSAKLTKHMQHVRKVSQSRHQFICSVCGKELCSATSLKEHLEGMHAPTTNYTCTVDGKKFTTALKLRRHMNSHHEADPSSAADTSSSLTCELCGHTSENQMKLAKHRVEVHNFGSSISTDETFICESCGYIAKRKINLSIHRYRVHGQKPDCPCPYCGKEFENSYKFKKHLKRLHINEMAEDGTDHHNIVTPRITVPLDHIEGRKQGDAEEEPDCNSDECKSDTSEDGTDNG